MISCPKICYRSQSTPTTGEIIKEHTTFFAELHLGGISIAHNGNLTSLILRETLVKEGAIFRTTSDTETIVQLIAKSKERK